MRIRALPLTHWPAGDRDLWQRQAAPGRPRVGVLRPACTLRDASVDSYRKGYGMWLGYLSHRGVLDPDQTPAERVTAENLVAYFEEASTSGLADYTVVKLFTDLRGAMRVLHPERSWKWVCSPCGIAVRSVLDMRGKPKKVIDSAELFAAAVTLMDSASPAEDRRYWQVQYRDGLYMAMLASSGRRRRAVSGLRVGRELIRDDQGYRVEIPVELDKTRRFDTFRLVDVLTPYVARYLDEIRPGLLRGRCSEYLWINSRGDRVTAKDLGEQMAVRTEKIFGVALRPHAFKHSLATTCVLRRPDIPGLATEILRTSAAVLEKHYISAGQVRASRVHAKLMRSLSRKAKRAARGGKP